MSGQYSVTVVRRITFLLSQLFGNIFKDNTFFIEI